MWRDLYIGRQNPIEDVLEVSTDAGVTFTAVNVAAAAQVVVEIYDDPDDPLVTLYAKTTHAAQFTLGSDGTILWTPAAGLLTEDLLGRHDLRYIIQTAIAGTGGEVFEADGVEIKL